jgi:Matrixin
MAPTRPLCLELLEDRLTPATFGNPWPDASHLTLSFAPDGTPVDGATSTLQQTLNAVAPTAAWQREILRAFQTLAVQANINIGVVGDQGLALGSPGRPQGDNRFGDIRLVGEPLSTDSEMAIASPFEFTSGTWAGDVRLATNAAFGINKAGTVDLFTAMLHEAGHTLGLDHSPDPASVMYENYLGPRTGLSAGDIANIQALYGARTPDIFEGAAGNNTLASASSLSLPSNPDGSLGIGLDADLTSSTDIDVYKFSVPLNYGGLTVSLQTAGLSLLISKITLLDSSGNVVSTAAATNPQNGNLVIKVSQLQVLKTYYLKVERNSSDVFGIGGYHLNITLSPLLSSLISTLTGTTTTITSTLLNNDLHTNDSFLTAGLLSTLGTNQTDSRFDYAYRASISDSSDVDFYKIKAPMPPAGWTNVMTAMVWGMDNGGLIPNVSVYDANQNVVPADILVNENGVKTVQVVGAVGGANYYVKVAADQPKGPNNVGNYFLGIDFSTKAVQLNIFLQGALDASNTQISPVLNVQQNTLFHFVLSADANADVAVNLTIVDQNGVTVSTIIAQRGKPLSLTYMFLKGAYTFRISAVATSSAPPPPLTFSLTGLDLTDPIGPQPDDPTMSSSSSSSTTTSSSSSTTTSSSGSSSTYYWSDPNESKPMTYSAYSYPYSG